MPFIKYSNANHICEKPEVRDDGEPLQIGDEWQCDAPLSSLPGDTSATRLCGKTYRWVMDQRDGTLWMLRVIGGCR